MNVPASSSYAGAQSSLGADTPYTPTSASAIRTSRAATVPVTCTRRHFAIAVSLCRLRRPWEVHADIVPLIEDNEELPEGIVGL